MKKLLKIFLFSLAIAVASCSGEDELPANLNDADSQGRADAIALCDANYTAERDLHAALLAVKSREWQMRQSGDSVGASVYIEAFKQQLSECSRQLAEKVL